MDDRDLNRREDDEIIDLEPVEPDAKRVENQTENQTDFTADFDDFKADFKTDFQADKDFKDLKDLKDFQSDPDLNAGFETDVKDFQSDAADLNAGFETDSDTELNPEEDFDDEEADAEREARHAARKNKIVGFFSGILEKIGMLPSKIGPAFIRLRNLDLPEKINLPKWMGPVARMNLPNQLTLLRIILIPVFLGLLYWGFPGSRYVALFVFLLAALTDWFDGAIARKYKLITDFGKFADPLADKMLVTAAMLWFVETGLMPGWALAIVICREFAVSGLRMIAAEKGRVIAAGWSGKVKTATTMICVILMFFPLAGWLNAICVGVITLTTLYSGIEYFLKNRDILSGI